jgi:ATP-dependent helicase/nuclease subunit B
MDDAEWAECDLAETLPLAADGDFAEHWRETLRFLSIVTSVWPAWLAEQGVMNPAARQVALLRAQAALARGAGCRIAFVGRGIYRCGAGRARCAGCGAGPGRGRLVLPWVDLSLDEAIWVALPDGHPQAGLARLLGGLERTRADLAVWEGRRRCRCPARRRGAGAGAGAAAGGGAGRLAARRGRGDAGRGVCAAGRRPAGGGRRDRAGVAAGDRDAGTAGGAGDAGSGLAGRVAVELARWGVVADDSAGEPLHATPPAVFLRLLARAASGGLSPVALLSLLKHPLAACGLAPGACRASARLLERALLRGPAPRPGFAGLRDRLAAARDDAHGALADRPDAPEDLAGFVDRLERCLAPVLGFGAAESRPVGDLLTGLIAAAEALAATDEKSGADRLWAGEDGNALGQHLAGLVAFCDVLPAQPGGCWTGC